jgi:hypothetical protein
VKIGRFTKTVIMSVVILLISAGIALADNINDNIDASGPITLTAGDSSPTNNTSRVWVVANGGGEPGCDIDAGESLTITFVTPSGVTASPASVTFNACGTANGGEFHEVAFSASASAVSGTVTANITSNSTGTANTAYNNNVSIPITVDAAPVSNTKPSLTLPANMTVEGNTTGGANVSFSASASDEQDGALTPSCSAASPSFFALGGPHTVTCSVTDSGGLSDSGSFTVTVVDTTDPTLSGMPADKTATATSATGASVTYTNPTASDVVDANPSVSCSPASGSQFAPGATTVTCTAEDASGNDSEATFTVTVSFGFRGFLAPVDGNKTLNGMKAGSTAPIKWQIPDGSGGYISDLSVVNRATSGVISCASGSSLDDLEQFTTGATSLRYDTTSNQYIYNWQSPKKSGTCYSVRIVLTDGSTHEALFQLR